MSVEAMAIALHHSRARGTAKVVLLGIANHDGDGGAFPKIATLAKYANVHPRRVVEALNTLGELGEIIIHHGDGGSRLGGTHRTPEHVRPNLYELVLECPPDCDRSKSHRVPGERVGRSYAGQHDPERIKDPAAVARGKASRQKYLERQAAIKATRLPGDENVTSAPGDENSTTPSVENDTTPSVENDTSIKNHPEETTQRTSSVSTSPGAAAPVENSKAPKMTPAQRRAAAVDGATPFGRPAPTPEQLEITKRGAAAARAALRGLQAADAAGAPAGITKEVAPLRHDQDGAA